MLQGTLAVCCWVFTTCCVGVGWALGDCFRDVDLVDWGVVFGCSGVGGGTPKVSCFRLHVSDFKWVGFCMFQGACFGGVEKGVF